MSNELQRILFWIESNKLTINESKSKILRVKTKLENKVQEANIASVLTNEMKFLGVTLDNTLEYKQHMNHLISRLS